MGGDSEEARDDVDLALNENTSRSERRTNEKYHEYIVKGGEPYKVACYPKDNRKLQVALHLQSVLKQTTGLARKAARGGLESRYM